LTVCPGMMRWLNYALVNSMWLSAVIRSENYQHHHHHHFDTCLIPCSHYIVEDRGGYNYIICNIIIFRIL
jgi:hypothetical protein